MNQKICLGYIRTSMDAECKCEYKTDRNQLLTRLETLEAEIEILKKEAEIQNLKKLVAQVVPGYGAQIVAPTPSTMQMTVAQPPSMRGRSNLIF